MTSPPRYDGLADWYDREIGGLEVTTTALDVLGRLVGPGPGTCLDLPLAAVDQEPRQPGVIAASAFNRRAPAPRDLGVGEVAQLLAGQTAVSGQERWCQADAGTRQTTRHQGSLSGA
jgi:hypothetical protein